MEVHGSTRVQCSKMEKGLEHSRAGGGIFPRISTTTSEGRTERGQLGGKPDEVGVATEFGRVAVKEGKVVGLAKLVEGKLMGGPSVGGGSILIGGDKVAEGDPGFAEPEITTFGREEGSIGLASCSETLPADRAEIGVIGKSARAEVLIRPGRCVKGHLLDK